MPFDRKKDAALYCRLGLRSAVHPGETALCHAAGTPVSGAHFPKARRNRGSSRGLSHSMAPDRKSMIPGR